MHKNPADDPIYTEKISSIRTEALFLALMILFLVLFFWRLNTSKMDILCIVFACLSILFLFYSLNYRTLIILLTPNSLKLVFGIFSWTVPMDNIESISVDELPTLMRLGGAGIHFMMIRNRYRASFNFLEYPRVVIAFRNKIGPVQELSFSTRQPGDVIWLTQEQSAAYHATQQGAHDI